ncbi:hypothetical protein [Bartonella refiksaydamii]|uniref:hypothetical protein n=1 Tax=Bartonella refiksaydamii TaxID=2654951 RepID=UPI001FED330C|nr:hypothetical protein [Bartonella refiksaydamii]
MKCEDGLYAIVFMLDWNSTEQKIAKGSAIFMHLAREDYRPTEGYIVLFCRDMEHLLLHISQRAKIIVLG